MPIPKSPERHPKRFKKPNSKQKTAIQHVLTSRGENDMIDETRHRDESRSARSVKDRDDESRYRDRDDESRYRDRDDESRYRDRDDESRYRDRDDESRVEKSKVDNKVSRYRDRDRDDESRVDNKVYPVLIRELLNICVGEALDVREAFKNRNRQKYKNIFNSYKDKLSSHDYSIVKSALFYLYEFSRVKSIDKTNALWMIGIYAIPTSQIISYTSKEVLKSIAKDHGLSYSNKKAEDLVESIRGVIDPSN